MGSRLEANSNAVRKRIEQHTFSSEDGDEYGASSFGNFPEYFRRKKIKLQNLDAERRQRSGNESKPAIFRGVVVHVNGYTQPTLQDLHAMIVDHGGGFLQYLDGKTMVTHIVAANLTLKKAHEFRKYRIVKPAWIVDSIQAGKLLPWNNYRLVNEGSQQNVLSFDQGKIRSQPGAVFAGYREQTESSWYTAQVRDRAAQVDSAVPGSQRDQADIDERRLWKVAPSQHTELKEAALKSSVDSADDQDRLVAPEAEVEPQSSSNFEPSVRASLTESFAMSGIEDEDLLGFDDNLESPSGSDLGVDQEVMEEMLSGQEAIDQPGDIIEEQESNNEPAQNDLESKDREYTEVQDMPKEPQERRHLSAEEHNALLLSDPKIWKSTVVNPGFLKQYYEESRLHHLSTWKAELKSKLQALAQERSLSQEARMKRPAGARRYVLHVDFDCFFAAVSLKKHPQHVEKPVVVAHGNGAGAEIASCNYEARKFGVKNGMWMRSAQELCSTLTVLPYDFAAYEAASKEFYDAIINTGGIVQSVSIDEALIDVSAICHKAGLPNGSDTDGSSVQHEQATAEDLAQSLRDLIKEKTGCAVSVGIGGNILLAKVALRKAKPAGQHHIKPEEVLESMAGLSVRDLPGVAYSIGGKLEDIGVKTVKDARELTKEKLMNTLGPKTGEKIFEYARGIDRTEVGEQVVRKSVSAEVNWGVRFVTQQQADEFVRSLCEELHRRLLNESVKGRQFTMKIMRRSASEGRDPPKHLGHGKCDVFNKSAVMRVPTNDANILAREAVSILRGYNFPPGELRGIGVQMTKLEPLKDTTPLRGGQKRLQFQSVAPQAAMPAMEQDDPIDEVETPKKPAHATRHPAALGSGDKGEMLNLKGTQFVLPSQYDPEVLAELPEDIRKGLAGPSKAVKQELLRFASRSVSPPYSDTGIEPPPESQIDSEILESLPEDIRAELQSFYKQQKSPSTTRQVRLPQSPHKSRIIPQGTKKVTPTKRRGRPRGLRVQDDPHSALLQSNIVPARAQSPLEEGSDDDIPAEVLDALPAAIREEVLAEHRNARLQQQGGLSIPTRRQMQTDMEEEVDDRIIILPPKEAKPTFTTANLSTLPEMRNAVSEWVNILGADGPIEEDIEALTQYLEQVILDELDLEKAVGIVKWLVYVVGEQETEVQMGWLEAVHQIQEHVQAAVAQRGLGAVRFE